MLDTALVLSGLRLFEGQAFSDNRGYFLESFNMARFEEATGRRPIFVQDNESMSVRAGTVRGLHYQLSPSAQGKLVRVVAGAVTDVAVDIRRTSPTFGQHVTVELSAANSRQLWIPPGFAHGFCTVEPDSLVAYKVDAFYDPDTERSINWPVAEGDATLSHRDAAAPVLADLPLDDLF